MRKGKLRKGLVVAIIVLFVGASVVPSTGMVEKSIGRSILYVGGSGPGNYSKIQDAIDNASAGDTVYVYNGTYHEHITVSKSYLNLLGENKETTIIDADGYGQGVDGAGVSIPEYCHYNFVSGFTVMNTTYVGIMIHADTAHSGATANYNTISDCIVRDCTGVGGIRILGHRWTCHADYNTVINCEVFNISGTGVLIQGGQGYAYYNKIINTTSYNNTVGIHVGGFQTDGSIISNCEIFNNTEYGLTIVSSGTTVYHNNLLNNAQNTFDSGTNTWYNATLQEGNYYSDYNGTDTDGDGIGDTPYNISGGSNQDLYPLMYPWYPTHPDTVYVDDDYDNSTPGWGYDRFNKIQYGVNEVEGSTVYVYNGSYYENVVIDKTINLVGEDKNNTIIDGIGSGDVVYVSADLVNISRFTIRNSGSSWGYAGIDIRSNYNNISGNNISHNGVGICLEHSSNNTITGNTICLNNWHGIRLYRSSKNNITDNNINSNIEVDIYIWTYCNSNTITSNNISNSRDGIRIDRSSSNTITCNNIISHNHPYGYGIVIYWDSNQNIIYHNNFINNTQNAHDEESNTWDNGYPSGGNYWDDYTGTDADGDGIGDIPYSIPFGDNEDRYPLMHPFEMYYILNISTPSEVNEGELFNVIVKSIGGPVIPLATVEFNDELKFTDSDGRAYFIAPLVETDTYYNITATKDGYTGDSETILVKDVPVEFESTFIFGRLDNLTTAGDIITFNAVNIRCATFFPFTFNAYTSGELLTISKDYFGLVGARFIFAFCGLTYQPSTSKISMNKFSQDDSANTVIWLVSGVEGNPVETKDVEMILLNESGQPQPDAEITFNEVNVEGYINPGDTFTVVAPYDGYFVFMLTHKISGATIYKGSLTHY